MRRGAAPDADFQAAAAQMIQHADLLGEPQRVMHRQHIDQRSEAQAFGSLRDGGEKDARRWRQVERSRMMLAHVIGAESRAVVELDQLEAMLILLGEHIRSVVVPIEDTELHDPPAFFYWPRFGGPDASLFGRRRF